MDFNKFRSHHGCAYDSGYAKRERTTKAHRVDRKFNRGIGQTESKPETVSIAIKGLDDGEGVEERRAGESSAVDAEGKTYMLAWNVIKGAPSQIN